MEKWKSDRDEPRAAREREREKRESLVSLGTLKEVGETGEISIKPTSRRQLLCVVFRVIPFTLLEQKTNQTHNADKHTHTQMHAPTHIPSLTCRPHSISPLPMLACISASTMDSVRTRHRLTVRQTGFCLFIAPRLTLGGVPLITKGSDEGCRRPHMYTWLNSKSMTSLIHT